MQIALLGCGDWGRNHARTLAELGVLAAVADKDPARALAVAESLGVGSATVPEVLADQSVDGVVMALPPRHHAPMALEALKAGKHLLVEKPMAMTASEAEAIVAEAAARNRVAMTGHILRFHPAVEALEALVAAGDLGEIRYVHATRLGLGKFFAETDVMWDIAPHDLSILLAIVGEEPLSCHLEGIGAISEHPDFAHLHLTFPSGARAHTFVSRLSPRRERRFTVIGSKAMAVLDDVEPDERKLAVYRHRVWREGGAVKYESVDPDYVPFDFVPPLTAELKHFIDAIRTGQTPRSSVREGLGVIRTLEKSQIGSVPPTPLRSSAGAV